MDSSIQRGEIAMPRGFALAVAIFGLATSPVASAKPPKAIVESVRDRLVLAGFDGAILIGEQDGSYAVVTTGDQAVPANAVWRWASITKQLAVVVAMQDVAAGRLDLDAPVSRYWPDWTSKNAASIRIRDLMLHNSGLPQPDASTPDSDGVPAFYRSKAALPQASAADFCAGEPRAKAPTDFDYNNCDTIVLAEILSRINSQPFDILVHERLARKLKMSSFGLFGLGSPVHPHVKPIGDFANLDPLLNLGVYDASGGAYGTIADLWKFNRALLRGKLLPAKERELMWKSTRENGYYGFFQWIYPAPLAGCKAAVRIVERQGLVGGIELRNYLLPETGRALILFSRKRPTNLGDPWEGKGFAFDLLSSAICRTGDG
jgi:D-alanyl-D-alanine carboxypeptidase